LLIQIKKILIQRRSLFASDWPFQKRRPPH